MWTGVSFTVIMQILAENKASLPKWFLPRLIADISSQGLLVVVVCWTIMELLSGVLRASPDASHLNIDIYIYL